MLTHPKYINLVWIIKHQIFKQIHLFSWSIGRLPWTTIFTSCIIHLPNNVTKSYSFSNFLTKMNMVKKVFFKVLNLIDEYYLLLVLYFIYLRGLLLFKQTSNFPSNHAFDLFLWCNFSERFKKELRNPCR